MKTLEERSRSLIYDKAKSPYENIEQAFKELEVIHFELQETKPSNNNRQFLFLGPWHGEDDLKELTMAFCKDFNEALLQAINENTITDNYEQLLKRCKELLANAEHYFAPNFNKGLILTRPLDPNEPEFIVKFESLGHLEKEMINRCYALTVLFFRQLSDIVAEALQQQMIQNLLDQKSTYRWALDKNKFSALILALIESKAVEQVDGKEMQSSVFARDLGKFLSLKDIYYAQDIESQMFRTASSRTEFLDDLSKKTEDYFNKRIENQG